MGFFSWKTADTGESVLRQPAAGWPERTVYLLQPNGMPPIAEPSYEGFGRFGGVDAYDWLARMNLPKDRLHAIPPGKLRDAGIALAYGQYFVDTFTGEKIAIFHDHVALVDPTINVHRGLRYDQPVPGYDGRTIEDLQASGAVTKHRFETEFPLKFSYDAGARYEALPASEDCPNQGYVVEDDDEDEDVDQHQAGHA